MTVDQVTPGAVRPGQVVTLNLSGTDPTADDPLYAATDILVHAPTVDGERLALDVNDTRQRSERSRDWQLAAPGSSASGPHTLHYEWNTSRGPPEPPDALPVQLAPDQPGVEGGAAWRVEFCVAVGPLRHCPDDHVARGEHVFDNVAPDLAAALRDPRNNTGSPFHRNVTLTLDATDGGSGVATVRWRTENGRSGPYTGPVRLTAPGRRRVAFHAVDAVGHRTAGQVTPIVVDGLDFAAVPAQVAAGGSSSLVVRFAEDADAATSAGIDAAAYPVNVTLASGPGPLQGGGRTTATNGTAVYDVAFETVGTYRLNASSPHLPTVRSAPIVVTPGPLATLRVRPSAVQVQAGGVADLQTSGEDAFGNPVAVAPTWATTCGTITQTGQLVAPDHAATCSVTATQDGVTGAAQVTVEAPTGSVSDGSSSSGGSTPSGGDGGGGSLPTVSDLTSPTHAAGTWTDRSDLTVRWSPPDADVAGYAFRLSDDGAEPASTVQTGETSIEVTVPADGNHSLAVRPILADGTPGRVARFGPILVDTRPPVPPGRLTGEATPQGVRLAWTRAASADGSPPAGYVVERSIDGPWTRLGDGAVEATTVLDEDVRAGQTVAYRVRTRDAAGNEGPPTKPARVTVEETPEAPNGSGGDPPTDLTELYRVLQVEPGEARLVDADGDGTADALDGDPRLSVTRTTVVDGAPAFLVALGDAPPSALLTASGRAHPLDRADAGLRGAKLGKVGLVVTAETEPLDGWALVHVPDDRPDRTLRRVVDADGDRIPDDRVWRPDAGLVLLDDTGPTYVLVYEAPARDAAPGQATPGLAAPGALAGLLAGLVLVRCRAGTGRDP